MAAGQSDHTYRKGDHVRAVNRIERGHGMRAVEAGTVGYVTLVPGENQSRGYTVHFNAGGLCSGVQEVDLERKDARTFETVEDYEDALDEG